MRIRPWLRIGCRSGLIVWLAVMVLSVAGTIVVADTWLLSIGISRYRDPAITDLSYASLDAASVAEQLRALPDITSERVIQLADGQASRGEIESAFEDLAEWTTPADTVLIYLAGHGASTVDIDGDEADGDGLDEAYLPYDAILGDPGTYILDDDLGVWVENLPAASVAMFFDACYSGGQSRDAGEAHPPMLASQDSTARDILTSGIPEQTRAVLAACQPWEQAYESRSLGHGVFTHFLLQGLDDRETDENGDGVLSMQELAAVVISSIESWTATRPEKQQPVLESNRDSASLRIADVSQSGRAVLVAHYPLDGDTQDRVGGRDGRSVRAEPAAGVVDGAMQFDHDLFHNTFIRTIDSYEPRNLPFSVSVWFRVEKSSTNRTQYVLSTHGRENWYGPTYELYVSGDGSIIFRTNDAAENHRQVLSTTSWGWHDNQWHHVAVVRRADGRVEIWLDGSLETSRMFPVQDLRNGENPLTIGATAYNGWAQMLSLRGEIDDLRIYEGALTTHEIRDLFSLVVPDTPVSIPDPLLQQVISEALEIPPQQLSRHALLALRTLDIGGMPISSLEGVELCSNLREVDVSGLDLVDLDVLGSCPAIVELDASNNRLSSVAVLEDLRMIETIDLARNRIEDISPMALLRSLAYCDLSENRISDLAPLAGCAALKTLGLRGNPIGDPEVLALLPRIWYLDLGACGLTSVEPLRSCYNVEILLLDENELTDLSPLADLFSVEQLDVSDNRIRDISPLAELVWLGDFSHISSSGRDAVLDLSGNLISEIAPLVANIGLDAGDVIDLRRNPLTDSASFRLDLEALEGRGVTVLFP